MASGLLQLPRLLGEHPEGGKVQAGLGRFGAYVVQAKGKGEKDYRSLKADDDVLAVGFERAMELLSMPKRGRGGRTALKALGTPDGSDEAIQLFDGPYGLYVKQGKVNASLPEGTTAETITLEQAVELLEAKAATKKSSRKSTAKKKPAARNQRPKACGTADNQNGPAAGQCCASDQGCRQLMARPLLVGLLPLLLVGCSSTPLGQQLGASFDAPPPAEPQPAAKLEPAIKPVPAQQPKAEEPKAAPEPAQPAEAAAETTPAPEPEPTAEPEQAAEPRDPQPYRVILRLPSADPSAPAEAVTKALRAAGLPFEVETIERLQPAKQP